MRSTALWQQFLFLIFPLAFPSPALYDMVPRAILIALALLADKADVQFCRLANIFYQYIERKTKLGHRNHTVVNGYLIKHMITYHDNETKYTLHHFGNPYFCLAPLFSTTINHHLRHVSSSQIHHVLRHVSSSQI